MYLGHDMKISSKKNLLPSEVIGLSKETILLNMALAEPRTFPWESMTPFGFPVVPDVYIITADFNG